MIATPVAICGRAIRLLSAAIDHVRDWWLGTPEGTYSAMAVPSMMSEG